MEIARMSLNFWPHYEYYFDLNGEISKEGWIWRWDGGMEGFKDTLVVTYWQFKAHNIRTTLLSLPLFCWLRSGHVRVYDLGYQVNNKGVTFKKLI